LRLTGGPPSGWGTSLLLLPVSWRAGRSTPDQGAPVTARWQVDEPDLVLAVGGTMAGLAVAATVRLAPRDHHQRCPDHHDGAGHPPAGAALRRGLQAGHALLDAYSSRTCWDTQAALAGGRTYPIPEQGWISPSPVAAARFGLHGGRSRWQAQAPTIEVILARPLPITGWVTASQDPHDDNVGWWAAADQVVPAWSYSVRATRCVSDGAGHIEAAGVRWSRP
jgi:hypothetical protein